MSSACPPQFRLHGASVTQAADSIFQWSGNRQLQPDARYEFKSQGFGYNLGNVKAGITVLPPKSDEI